MHTGMIVDDASIMRVRLREILDQEFKIVAEADNGDDALRMYQESRPEFVTLDITMPKLNGIAALRNILTFDPGAKVVIVSAVGQKQIVFDAITLGAKDFIIKPFEHERVLKSIRRLFD